MTRRRILEEWNAFRSKVLPADISEIQHIETRRAFYAGAIACFSIINRITEQTPDEEGMQLFDELALEFGKYAEDLRSGKL